MSNIHNTVQRISYVKTKDPNGNISRDIPFSAEAKNVYIDATLLKPNESGTLQDEWKALTEGSYYRASEADIKTMFNKNRI